MRRRTRPGAVLTELFVAVRHLRTRLDSVAQMLAAPSGFTAAGWWVATALGEDQASVPEIAARLGRRRQTVQVAVDDLEAAGFAAKIANPRNARSPLIALTTTGRAAFWDVTDRQAQWVNTAARSLDEAELAAAVRVLDHLVANLTE